MNTIKELNFIRSAIVPVRRRGVIHANISWNFTNSTPGIVGAKSSAASDGTPLRNTHSVSPIRPCSDGLNEKLNPNTNHITLSSASPKKICMKIDEAFFFLKRPDSKRPSAGIIKSTRLPATSIHAVSPESRGIQEKINFWLITLSNFDVQMIIICVSKT